MFFLYEAFEENNPRRTDSTLRIILPKNNDVENEQNF